MELLVGLWLGPGAAGAAWWFELGPGAVVSSWMLELLGGSQLGPGAARAPWRSKLDAGAVSGLVLEQPAGFPLDPGVL